VKLLAKVLGATVFTMALATPVAIGAAFGVQLFWWALAFFGQSCS
jgi:hypothetical protein